ncbi:MAG: hypothetical protein CMJ64_28820 [Planctomycetaceae bacterium]|nr:hypothetical protein [Planctomycetaceae bacterium]
MRPVTARQGDHAPYVRDIRRNAQRPTIRRLLDPLPLFGARETMEGFRPLTAGQNEGPAALAVHVLHELPHYQRHVNRLRGWSSHSSEKSRNTTHRMFRTTTMIRAPPVCALTAQIASICISNVELQQFFARKSRPNSFVTPNFTAETFVEPDVLDHS